MKFGSTLCALVVVACASSATAHTQEEIDQHLQDLMDPDRQQDHTAEAEVNEAVLV